MRRTFTWGIALVLLACGFGLDTASAAPPLAPALASSGTSGTPVLVELFTSEGCSSCPPADAVLEHLVRANDVPNARVVALAHHVDYWDSLGWPDPFASAEATARQRRYATLGAGTYTPQAVVDGKVELVGSRAAALGEAVAAAAARPHAKVTIAASLKSAAPRTVDVSLTVDRLPDGAASDAELIVAIVQGHARVTVARGENAGRTLDHVAIVRRLESLAPVAAAGASRSAPVALPELEGPGFVTAFVQERASRRVLGSATAALPPR
jgi:hypothetical protein